MVKPNIINICEYFSSPTGCNVQLMRGLFLMKLLTVVPQVVNHPMSCTCLSGVCVKHQSPGAINKSDIKTAVFGAFVV